MTTSSEAACASGASTFGGGEAAARYEAEVEAAALAPGADASTAPSSPRVRYTLRPVVKPLPNALTEKQVKVGKGLALAVSVGGTVRAESEDDDGYDPYSDVHDGTARALTFEEDPWN